MENDQWAALPPRQRDANVAIETEDGVEVYASMTVYGISPWGDTETLYVEDDLEHASTCYVSEGSGGAASCRFDTAGCFSSTWAAEVAMSLDPSRCPYK